MKRLVGISVAYGTPIRVAYKDVKRRMRIEGRREKELDEGVKPEVVPDSFLRQVKVEQQPQSAPLKRVLTPSAKAAKHRRARDKKLRETLCWWIANDKVCPHDDRCVMAQSCTRANSVCETGVSWPGHATEQDESETGVLSPGPSTKPTHPRSPTRDRWNNSWDTYDVPSHLDSDRSHQTASQNSRNQSWSMPLDVLSRETEENVLNVRALESVSTQ